MDGRAERRIEMSETNNEKKCLINRSTIILSDVVCFLPILAGILLYPRLPEQMAIHWDVSGQPNGWAGKIEAVFLLPGLMFLIQLAMPFLLRSDPRNKNLNPKIASLLCWILPLLNLVCATATLMGGLGMEPRVEIIIPLFLGFLFLVIGNFMPKMTPSYTVGIKLPWTLHSEENWNRTHRLGGFLWVLGGLVIMASSFFAFRLPAMIVSLVVMVLVPVIYSYCLYKKGI